MECCGTLYRLLPRTSTTTLEPLLLLWKEVFGEFGHGALVSRFRTSNHESGWSCGGCDTLVRHPTGSRPLQALQWCCEDRPERSGLRMIASLCNVNISVVQFM